MVWFVSSNGDEIINANVVTNVYQKDGKCYASLQKKGVELEVELEVDKLHDIRVLLTAARDRVI